MGFFISLPSCLPRLLKVLLNRLIKNVQMPGRRNSEEQGVLEKYAVDEE